jgi:hypothetical protein
LSEEKDGWKSNRLVAEDLFQKGDRKMILKLTSASGKPIRINSINVLFYEEAIDEGSIVKGTFITPIDSQFEPILVKESMETIDAKFENAWK